MPTSFPYADFLSAPPLLAEEMLLDSAELPHGAAPPSSPVADNLLWFCMVAAVVVLAALTGWRLASGRERRRINSPHRLLGELCAAHGLGRREQRLLRAAARVLNLQHPARLFLEPHLLAQASQHPLLASRRQELAELRRQLFGVLP
jgi:hypothetical protein